MLTGGLRKFTKKLFKNKKDGKSVFYKYFIYLL